MADIGTRRRLGGALWGTGAVVALLWGAYDRSHVTAPGVGLAPVIEVAALQTARVGAVAVELHEHVGADQVVVRLDPGALQEEAAVASAQLLAIQQEAAAAAAGQARRFAEGAEGVQLDAVRLSIELQDALAQRDVLHERLSLEQDLAAQGAASEQAVAEWRRQIRIVQARIDAGQAALRVAQAAADAATARTAGAPEGNPWTVVAQTRVLEQIEAQIARTELIAGVEGQITWIHRRPGEVVRAGEPVLEVRPTETRQVVAFVQPRAAGGLASGHPVEVVRTSGEVLSGRLVSVGLPPSEPQGLGASVARLAQPGGVPIRVQLERSIASEEEVSLRL